ncbi:hypothetical protein KI387_021089, partial [Taxus chinensis]
EKLVNRDISRESRQKNVLENARRTAALSRAAVTGPAALIRAVVTRPPPYRAA